MECIICHEEKVPYEFAVLPRAQGLICFDCHGPYTCCECGVEYPSTHYRIQGRMYVKCRNNRTGVANGKIARAYVRVLNSTPNAVAPVKSVRGGK
jgi:hypothetical protein